MPGPIEQSQLDRMERQKKKEQENITEGIEGVDHPYHYNAGSMEVMDAIEGLGLPFTEGTILKYLARHPHKGQSLKDIDKAMWYMTRLRAKARLAAGLPLTDYERAVCKMEKPNASE